MNVNSWLKKAKRSVATLDADLILAEVLGFLDRSELVLRAEKELTVGECAKADAMLARRQKGEPLAYILGRKEFYGRDFFVTPDTLIPRPETEDAIDMVKDFVGNSLFECGHRATTDEKLDSKEKNQPNLRGVKILDVGTGSGCIGVTLALEMAGAEVVCLDISKEALGVAQKNAKRLGVKNVEFLESDLLSSYNGVRPDVVVANLPYVSRGWNWISSNLEYEPELALFAEDSGLALIKLLLDEIHDLWYNKSNGSLRIFLEADPCQHEQIIDYAVKQDFRLVKRRNYILELAFWLAWLVVFVGRVGVLLEGDIHGHFFAVA